MMKFIFSILVFVVFAGSVLAQDHSGKKGVDVVSSPELNQLVEKHKMLNEKKKGIPGYRVQIHFGSNRDQAKDIKTKFLTIYPQTKAYEIYQQPNFKIRVGDFRTKAEAKKLLKEIASDFPNSFIVQDDVNPEL